MKIVKFKEDAHFEIGYWGYKHYIPAGIGYVFFDEEISKIEKYKQLYETRELTSESRLYEGQDLTNKSLLFISLGGYGDALCFLQAINSLRNKYPSAQIDVSTHMDIFMFIRQFSYTGGWLSYPLRLGYFKEYDYYQSSDSICSFDGAYKENIARLYGKIFKIDIEPSLTQFSCVDVSRLAVKLKHSGRKRVAIQVDTEKGSTRAYPHETILDLAGLLCGSEYEVYLVGSGFSLSGVRRMNGLHDYTGATATVLELAGILAQMDVIITPDSVSAHIGGILGVPTIVLFSVTGEEKTNHYTSTIPVVSSIPCSPCYDVARCKLGSDFCQAFYDTSMDPEAICKKVVSICH